MGMADTVRGAEDAGRTAQQLTAEDIAALTKLKSDYALATDVLVGGDVGRGAEVYRQIFTPDAEFLVAFDEASPLMSASGLDAWLDSVQAGVAETLASQHHVGAVSVDPGDGPDTARITATFQATMVAKADKGLTTVLGTYYDEARRIEGRWWLTRSYSKYLAMQSGTRDAP